MKIKFPKIPSKLTSRKFWLAIIAAIIPVLNKEFNWGLDEQQIILVIGSLLTFILGESYVDAKRAENL